MKKITFKQRARDVLRALKSRRGRGQKNKFYNGDKQFFVQSCLDLNIWIDKQRAKGLLVVDCMKKPNNVIAVRLPENMNFVSDYVSTVQTLTAIRKLVELRELARDSGYKTPRKTYKIGSVVFDSLRNISTSAALVLTAEISRWDDLIKKKLTPQVAGWHESVFNVFYQLGFFDLFSNKPQRECCDSGLNNELSLVKFYKGDSSDPEVAKKNKKEIKKQLIALAGSDIPKWTFLHSGLSEAVTNVTHHAYPHSYKSKDRSWFLTGSYNEHTKRMTVSFFDHGVGIPNTLPDSKIWEKIIHYFNNFNIPLMERKLDEVLLKAAVSIDRTSTGELDRGKGLQDLLEFIRQRQEGYLSIISRRGLYECHLIDGVETIKTNHNPIPLCGTLISWCVTLE